MSQQADFVRPPNNALRRRDYYKKAGYDEAIESYIVVNGELWAYVWKIGSWTSNSDGSHHLELYRFAYFDHETNRVINVSNLPDDEVEAQYWISKISTE